MERLSDKGNGGGGVVLYPSRAMTRDGGHESGMKISIRVGCKREAKRGKRLLMYLKQI